MRALAEQAGQLGDVGTVMGENVRTLGMEQVLERRISHVAARYRPLLSLAATLGREVEVAILARLLPELDMADCLRDCANAAVLENKDGSWRFTHDKLREHILSCLEPAARQALHRQVAAAME